MRGLSLPSLSPAPPSRTSLICSRLSRQAGLLVTHPPRCLGLAASPGHLCQPEAHSKTNHLHADGRRGREQESGGRLQMRLGRASRPQGPQTLT